SLAPGGGENDEPFGLRIARRLETGHWRDMNMLARRGQRMLERRSETPGAAALRAHQQDGRSAVCRMIATETRSWPPPREPEHKTTHPHCRHAERQHTQHEAERCGPLPGMQHVDGFRYLFPHRQLGPGQKLTRPLIEIAGAAIRLQSEGVRGVARIGKECRGMHRACLRVRGPICPTPSADPTPRCG